MTEPIKIGVNFPVIGSALEACVAVNAKIASLTPSLISFGKAGNSSPHVTIAMGALGAGQDIARVETLVRSFVDELPKEVRLEFGSIYRETLTGHYIFSDVTLSEAVQGWRARVQSQLDSIFVEPARTSDVPHLSLGHISRNYESVDSCIGSLGRAIPSCSATSLDISFSGPKGIKQTVLRSMELEG